MDTGQSAVEDACSNVSKMRLGEAVLQTGLGLPMFEALFNGIPNPAIYENALRVALENVDGVVSVNVIELSQVNHSFNYSATIETEFGNTFTLNG